MLLPKLNLTAPFSILLPPSLRAVQGNGEWVLWSFHSNLSLSLLHSVLLLSVGSLQWATVLPELLQCGSFARGTTIQKWTAPVWAPTWASGLARKPAPARAVHRLKLPSGHVHPLRCGLLHGLQMDVCCTVNSMSRRVTPLVIYVGYRTLSGASASPPPTLTLTSAELFHPHFFSLLVLTASVCHFLPFTKHCQRDAISLSVWLSCVHPAAGWGTGAAPLFSSQSPPLHSPLLSTPCQKT